MRGADRIPLLLIALALGLALLAPAATAAYTTTTVHVVKVASDGRTVLAEKTVDYHWLETHLPVMGDGSTHYYHQGPTNDPNDLWDPTESKSWQDDDMGALKGTRVSDICGLVGGMSPGDTLEVVAADGYPSTPFSYGTVCSPTARQGPMVLTWFRGEDGTVPAYWSGMKTVFFADTSTNSQHAHVFGVSDMKASMPESEWGDSYKQGVKYPSTTALAIRYVNELRIHSTMKPTTSLPTKTPTTPVPGNSATPSPVATPPATTVPGVTITTLPVTITTAPETITTAPVMTVTPTGGTTVPFDDSDSSVIETVTPTANATATTVPNVTAVPDGTASLNVTPTIDASANLTPNATPATAPTQDGRTYDYTVSTGFDYSAIDEATEMPTTATATPTTTATPDPTATAVAVSAAPTPPPTTTPPTVSPSVTGSTAGRSFNRSVSFSFSVKVHESGDPALAPTGSLEGFVLAFLRAFAYVARALTPA